MSNLILQNGLFLLADLSPQKSTLPGIIVCALLGITLVCLGGWGLAALLGRKFLIRIGLVLLAALVGLIGAVIGDAVTATKRPLNEREKELAQLVFGESLDYSKIRLVLNTRLMVWPKRRMSKTPFNNIFLSKKYSNPPDSLYPQYEDLLVHELTHAWQTQHGIPFRKKLGTALRVIFNKKKTYNYGGKWALLHRDIIKKDDFRDFNTEQQGKILEHYFCCCFHAEYRQSLRTDRCLEYEPFVRQVRYNDGYFIAKDTFP